MSNDFITDKMAAKLLVTALISGDVKISDTAFESLCKHLKEIKSDILNNFLFQVSKAFIVPAPIIIGFDEALLVELGLVYIEDISRKGGTVKDLHKSHVLMELNKYLAKHDQDIITDVTRVDNKIIVDTIPGHLSDDVIPITHVSISIPFSVVLVLLKEGFSIRKESFNPDEYLIHINGCNAKASSHGMCYGEYVGEPVFGDAIYKCSSNGRLDYWSPSFHDMYAKDYYFKCPIEKSDYYNDWVQSLLPHGLVTGQLFVKET